MSAALDEVVDYLDRYLCVAEIPDFGNALNGLQVEGPGPVERVAVAVDATAASIDAAAADGAQLLLVHHGLFWDGHQPVTGRRYRRLRALFDAGLAVYAAHIPLDVHPEVGNNVVLARELGIELEGTFGDYRGIDLGVHGRLAVTRETLAARLDDLLDSRIKLIPGGPERLERVGVITGGGGSYAAAAAAAGLDALVSGEGNHHTYFEATESGLNLYYGGHYATETWGVKALAAHLEARFGVSWRFIDQPTGL